MLPGCFSHMAWESWLTGRQVLVTPPPMHASDYNDVVRILVVGKHYLHYITLCATVFSILGVLYI